ncbi:transporter substrate-binding domain-containing protein [Metapseudomonas otitidis]|uniref:transporter substrate-binding domain-containing protein n=1 Tax=Metapseudomonas otitidis TaxID=319939 RepID=UPI00227B3BAA|nr:transporter substrate-binding domain-containing protein [Pseudomonas otitidis]WAF84787.1 transporter substrate-binding domain-containing protein [Pseudomonas otitidis]
MCLRLLKPLVLLALTVPLLAQAASQSIPLGARTLALEEDITLEPEERAWLAQRGELRLAIADDLPPFDITSSGRDFEGITADVAGLLSRQLQVPVRVERYPSRSAALRAVSSGEADLLSASNDFEGREQALALSLPYAPDQPSLVARQQDKRDWPRDLGGLRIAIVGNYLPLEMLQNRYPDAILTLYPTTNAALNSVVDGDNDLYLGDLISANYQINQVYDDHLHIVRLADLKASGISFASARGNTRLLALVNKVLQRLPTGNRTPLIKRWSGGASPSLLDPELPFTEEERAWLAAHSVIRVATYGNYAPVSFFDNEGNYHGITADLLDQIRIRTGLRFEIVRTPQPEDMMNAVLNDEADIVGAGYMARIRQRDMAYSRPYMHVPFATITLNDAKSPSRLSELHGQRLAVIRGYFLNDYIRSRYPGIRLVETSSLLDCLVAVANGEAEGAVMSTIVAEYYIRRMFPEQLRISELIDVPQESIAFAMRKEDTLLQSILDKATAAIPPDELAVLVKQRWRSNVEISGTRTTVNRELIMQILSISGLLLLVSLGWILYLRRQIGRRKKAEQALNDQFHLMEALVNGTPHPIYVRDRDGRLLMCNDNYLQALALRREDVIGQPPPAAKLGSEGQRQTLLDDYRKVTESGVPLRCDRELYSQAGPLSIYHWIEPYRDFRGEIKGVVSGWIDISERLQLVEDLQAAKERADDANRAKSTFLATMSHEIRTPMNAVIGMLELALERADQGQWDRAAIEIAHGSARDLLELIGNILDIARIESGRLSLSPVRSNLREQAEAVIRVFDGLARQKNLRLTLEFDHRAGGDVLVDPVRFRQILTNLVGNAIKFTDVGGVSIDIQAQPRPDKRLGILLKVEDSGRGISDEDQAQLFQAFSQGSVGADEARRGTGLGLVICRVLCEMMGGTIRLESELGRGTCIWVELDLLELDPLPRHARQEEEDAPVARQVPLDVLVVDDNPANRELLKQQLTFLGHRVTEAVDGRDGLDHWSKGHFDLVISDCNMPVMNGYALARAVREEEARRESGRVHFIGYTANAQSEEHERCRKAGMDACLFKPISLRQLARQLATLQPSQALEPLEMPELPALPTTHPEGLFGMKEFLQLAGSDPALRQRLLDTLLTANREDLDQLHRSLDEKDWEEVAAAAHKIKGAARIVHAQPLVSCCEALEEAWEGRQPEDVMEQLAHDVTREVERLEQALLEFCAEPV